MGVAAAHVVAPQFAGGLHQELRGALQVEGVNSDSENVETRRIHRRFDRRESGEFGKTLRRNIGELPEKLEQGRGGVIRQRVQLKGSERKRVVVRARVGHDHDFEARGVGGGVAGGGVFEGHDMCGRDPEGGAGGEVNVWRRFGIRYIIATESGLKVGGQSQPREVSIDVVMVRIGGDGQGQSKGAGVLQEFDHAGENGLVADDFILVPLKRGFELAGISVWTEGGPRVESDVGVADDMLTRPHVELESRVDMDLRPRLHQGGLGIENQTVEIEDEGTNHGGVETHFGR